MVPEIPERRSSTSSKKTSKRTRLEIEIERNDTENKAKAMRQALKPQASFGSAYWIQNAKIAITSKRSVELQKEISKQWVTWILPLIWTDWHAWYIAYIGS
jgi:hypothetical protein